MKNRRDIKIPELLAPAGTMKHLRAAVNAGADAVYAGGKKWGARAGAGNFSDEEMEEAADYCHLRGVRLYVTMNTLIFDDEIEDALSYASYLYRIGVDALIIQDMGLACLIREKLPDLPVHISTQASIYSIEGVLAMKKMGFERVVLAREVPLCTIKEIAEKCGTELEVFIHGALCFCYSGQCQMSRVRGGRSGNRGMCAQPCRLMYKDKNGRTGYFLSPKDLCSIDLLEEMIDAGVSSLKIEGRMKSPEYVAVVVSIYRKYLDMYRDKGHYKVLDEDRKKLSQIFNRGGFTEGYLSGDPGEGLMSGEIPKHQGIRIGRVIRKCRDDLVEIRLYKGEDLSIGDGVEIRNREMPGNVVTYIKEKDEKGVMIIGDIKGHAAKDDEVYKITDKALMQEASMFSRLDKDGREMMKRKTDAAMCIFARPEEKAVLRIYDGSTDVKVLSERICEKARNRSLTPERAKTQLEKTGDTTIRLSSFRAEIEEGTALPVSELNSMRRRGTELFEEKKKASYKRKLPSGYSKDTYRADTDNGGRYEERPAYIFVHKCDTDIGQEMKKAYASFHYIRKKRKVLLLPVKYFTEGIPDAFEGKDIDTFIEENEEWRGLTLMPYISNVSMGNEDIYIRDNLDRIKDIASYRGIACGNAGWLRVFGDAGVPVTASFGMNSSNRGSEQVFKSMGAVSVMPSLETSSPEGAFPVMVTEHDAGISFFTDRNGEEFGTLRSIYGDKTIIYRATGLDRIFII